MTEKDLVKYLSEEFVEMRKDIKKILQRVSKLEVKAGMWGTLGGLISYFFIKYGDKL